jgi:hypothetical protein
MGVLKATVRAYRGRLPHQTNDGLTSTIEVSASSGSRPILRDFTRPRVPQRAHKN